jgi:hypothetical protein
MKGALIVLAIGFVIMIFDWRMAAPIDPKTRRRKPLTPTAKKLLREIFFGTIVVAIVVYFFSMAFE